MMGFPRGSGLWDQCAGCLPNRLGHPSVGGVLESEVVLTQQGSLEGEALGRGAGEGTEVSDGEGDGVQCRSGSFTHGGL